MGKEGEARGGGERHEDAGRIPVAPASISARDWASPNPRAAPVTTIVLPLRLKRVGSNMRDDSEVILFGLRLGWRLVIMGSMKIIGIVGIVGLD